MTQQQSVAPQFLWVAGPLLPITWLFGIDTWSAESVALHLVRTALAAVVAFHFWRFPNPERSARTNTVLTAFVVASAVGVAVFGTLSLYYWWRADQIDHLLGG